MMKIKDLKLKIVEKFKFFAPVSAAIILIGAILMLIIGMNVGIDFGGGAKLNMDFADLNLNSEIKSELIQTVETTVENEGFEIGSTRWSGDGETTYELGLKYSLSGKKVDASNAEAQKEFLDKIQDTDSGLIKKIVEAVNAKYPNMAFTIDDITDDIVSGSTSQRLLGNAIWATVVAVVIMLIYIGIRFTFSSGLAAVIALLHDVLVMLALTTIFRVQVNTTFIAAVITIVGYSINATIVIFDRIREVGKLESMKGASDVEIANRSIVETLGRSILTTITTLSVIVVLAIVCSIMGVSTMEEFALPIVFGLIAGTYSSVFLSASFWVYIRKLGAKIKAKAQKSN